MNYFKSTQTKKLVTLPAWRSRLLFILLLAGMGILILRAAYLQSINNNFLQQKGNARSSHVMAISAHRGMIADRHGEPLAISTPVESIGVNPQDVEVTPQQLNQLARIMSMDIKEVKRRLLDTTHDFVHLQRQLPPAQVEQIVKLGVPGLLLQREYRRYYPGGEVTAHLIGFTSVDDNGQEGLELELQSQLGGKAGSQRVIQDRKGHIAEDIANIRLPKPGNNIALSVDSKIQYLAYREIKSAVEQHNAQSGSIVVLDAQSGEVLALANWPSYNPNNRIKPSLQVLRNHAVTDLFEPGSTLKPFTVATALEVGKYTPDSVINIENGVFRIGKHAIHDTHPKKTLLTVSEVIQLSSNVGAAKIALSLSPEMLWRGLNDSGFGAQAGSGFPGEAAGKLHDHTKWKPVDQAAISYGHNISVSLLQLARAYTVFANNGELKPVSWLKLDKPASGKRVYSDATAHKMLAMLERVVSPEGTAPLAQVNGYRVAGKTGTAHKVIGGHYSPNRYISSFVGMAPASSPRLIVAVMLDAPAKGQYYGGIVAAPVFSSVMGAALRQLNVPNDKPLGNILMPPTEIVREEV